ncbi:MAG: hypothetical protein CM1200mP20_08070 [Pseudomonadota bacterium]|nr:MAG: hypothetical protein CM1200mP20_08070 [Pseudomonadota bacterium]
MENALDAGASQIQIAIERGGVKQISVADNGPGMSKEDLVLSVSRHATSKISGFDDLSRVTSLGFRGEALPSIASVSRLVIESRDGAEARAGRCQVWEENSGSRSRYRGQSEPV